MKHVLVMTICFHRIDISIMLCTDYLRTSRCRSVMALSPGELGADVARVNSVAKSQPGLGVGGN
jgi:hypothetical protein